jgi:hypothetical protein
MPTLLTDTGVTQSPLVRRKNSTLCTYEPASDTGGITPG